jgi:hypothetical protein
MEENKKNGPFWSGFTKDKQFEASMQIYEMKNIHWNTHG